MSAETSRPHPDRTSQEGTASHTPDHDGAALNSLRGIEERFDCTVSQGASSGSHGASSGSQDAGARDSAAYDAARLSEQLAQYQLARTLVAGKRVLDIGCGSGFGADMIAGTWQAATVVAIDNNSQAIETARASFPRGNLSFEQIDANDLSEFSKSLEKPFDTIVCCDTIQQLDDPQQFLQQLQQLGHDQTVTVVTVPNDRWRFGAGNSLNGFNQHQFSWLRFRQLAEGVLGTAEWFFGQPANGVVVDSIQNLSKAGVDYLNELHTCCEVSTALIRPTANARSTGSESLFFAGVWNSTESDGNELRTGVVFPSRADYRMPSSGFASRSARLGIRPRMALIVDTPGWAFDNIAGHLRTNLSDRFDFTTFYRSDYEGNGDDLFYELFYEHQFDHVHYFWREQIFNFLRNPQRIHKMLLAREIDFKDFAKRYSRTIVSTTIYDHLHSSEDDLQDRLLSLGLIDAYSVASPWLSQIYENGFPVPPASMTEDGVDVEQFQARNPGRFQNIDRPLIVGWAGNSKWGSTHADDPKGYHSIILPALDKLRSEGLNIEGNFADRDQKWRPREEMPQYYSEIDLLLCASLHEGTPNPVLEAMSCGVPLLTTDVGIVRMAVGPKQSQFVMKERSVECMVTLLRQVYRERDLLAELSAENLERIRSWQWRMKMPKWMQLFRVAQQRHEVQQAFKYTCLVQVLETMSIVKKVKDINARLRKSNENLQTQLKAGG